VRDKEVGGVTSYLIYLGTGTIATQDN
ncbi:MAG: hypothetical protein ACI8WB_003647, partial [Phenylobacterium sp.]